MCLAILRLDPSSDCPTALAFVRDEDRLRESHLPGYWWPDYPSVFGGQDTLYKGTWLAVDPKYGRAACILNRLDNPPPPQYAFAVKSRGDLPLFALTDPDFDVGAHIDYAPYTLLLANSQGEATAWEWDGKKTSRINLGPGLHTITRHGLNRPDTSPRQKDAHKNFLGSHFESWPHLLDGRDVPIGDDSHIVVAGVHHHSTFGTVGGSLISLGDRISFAVNQSHDLDPAHWEAFLQTK